MSAPDVGSSVPPSASPPLRVLELFSGIGGMHFALREAGTNATVVASMDVSDVANAVYRHNFPGVRCTQSNIEGLSADLLNQLGVEAVLMSPPCQPFTKQGLKKDLADARTEPLVRVLQVLPQVRDLRYVLVENVKGFEASEARNKLVETLDGLGFVRREFLLSPSHLGVPNSRLRYFLIAAERQGEGEMMLPSLPLDLLLGEDEAVAQVLRRRLPFPLRGLPDTLDGYLDKGAAEDDSLLLGNSTLLRYHEVLDLVRGDSRGSCCFTKAYGKYAEGTGSVLVQCGDVDAVYKRAREEGASDEQKVEALRELRLRYFSPAEISRLMGFPSSSFSFPDETTTAQQYRLLGNSLNVAVVALLVRIMLEQDCEEEHKEDS